MKYRNEVEILENYFEAMKKMRRKKIKRLTKKILEFCYNGVVLCLRVPAVFFKALIEAVSKLIRPKK